MFKADRLIIVLFLVTVPMLLASNMFVNYFDEAATLFLALFAVIDSTINKRWKQYAGLWIFLGIMTFYAVYSITTVHFNSPPYILLDVLLESKPFVTFFTFFAIAPDFTTKEKTLLRIVAVTTGGLSILILMAGYKFIITMLGHPYTAGSLAFLGAICYWYGSIDSDGNMSKRDRLIVMALLCGGLLCTRSKYYGNFVLSVFFLYFYRPGLLKHLNIKHVTMVLSLFVLVVAVAWKKISYYFITGNSDVFDPNLMSSMARAALLMTTPFILLDFIPFGSGLASYASYPSSANYSGLYSEYSLDKIWGLSPTMPDFITDLYFASLAQVGIAGIILFIYFWVYAYRYLKFLLRLDAAKYKSVFSIGSLIICFVLIECVGGNTFVQPTGQVAMMLLGIICGQGKRLMHQAATAQEAPQENQDNSPHLPEKTLRHKI